MKKPFNITISRPSCGNDDEYISIQVQDNKSRARFLELKVDYDDFAKLMTGLSNVHCRGEARKLDLVGKVKVSKPVEIEIPEGKWNWKAYANSEIEKYLVGGYVAHWGFSSKCSFFQRDGKSYAKTNIFKWVDEQEKGE